MTITEKLIEDINKAYGINDGKLDVVYSQTMKLGYLTMQGADTLTSIGINITRIVATIARISERDAYAGIIGRVVSYGDFLCILGIIAQDAKQNILKG